MPLQSLFNENLRDDLSSKLKQAHEQAMLFLQFYEFEDSVEIQRGLFKHDGKDLVFHNGDPYIINENGPDTMVLPHQLDPITCIRVAKNLLEQLWNQENFIES
tara:strand:+ start:8186 stop:8494 length:309 start_codon:yes stop_codon:yes gene_type:complete